jgi:methionine sulfoxide reductase heme-binding subunit
MSADWYLMRSSGVVALVLLTAVLVLGIATFRRWGPSGSPRFVTAALHRAVSLLAVVFLAVHVLTAIVDPYAAVGAAAVAVPFVAGKSPLWVGLGAVSLDLVAALVLSSLLRRRVGARAWRAIHGLAYLAWPLAFAHSFGMGSDATTLWLEAVGASCAAAVVAALGWRLGSAGAAKQLEPRPAL